MTTMAVPSLPMPRAAGVRKPAPWSFALVGALAVAVVVGGSVAVTQAAIGDRLDTLSSQVDEQAQQARQTAGSLTAVQGQLNSEAAIAQRRAAAAQAEIAALRKQLAAETARATQADAQILSRLPRR